MGWGYGNLGGGAGLNFKVVGGTVEPSNPQENTIWVNTSVDITGWEFSSVQPSSPENGMVWFTTGRSSPVAFNALKKNTMQIYPISAEQYVSGAWNSVTAKSYQGGVWVDWISYIYNSGTEYYEFSAIGVANNATSGYKVAPTITRNDTSIVFTESSSGLNCGIAYVADVSLADFSTLKVKYSLRGIKISYDLVKLQVYTSIGAYVDSNSVASVDLVNGDGELSLDVSTLSGAYAIGFSFVNHANPPNEDMVLTISEMWLE